MSLTEGASHGDHDRTAIPISGRETDDARWAAIKPVLLDAATLVFDEPAT